MKMKTFSCDDAVHLEQAGSDWLAAHPDITIVHIAQSMGRTVGGVDQVILTILYTELTLTLDVPLPDTVATVVPPLATPVVAGATTPDPPT